MSHCVPCSYTGRQDGVAGDPHREDEKDAARRSRATDSGGDRKAVYEDDPDLVQAVKNIDRSRGIGIRLPLVGLIGGLAIVVAFFTSQTLVALAGFTLMVVSATARPRNPSAVGHSVTPVVRRTVRSGPGGPSDVAEPGRLE